MELKINKTPKFIIGVLAFIKKNERYLILKRSDKKSDPGLWETVGGKLELNETPEAALIREIFEETGLHIRSLSSPIHFSQTIKNGSPMLLIYYFCENPEGEIKLSNDHSEYAWVNFQDFQRMVSLKDSVNILEKFNHGL